MRLSALARRLATTSAQRKLLRAIPVLGLFLSVLYVVRTIRAKGVARGSVDAALDMTPGVGRAKALVEAFRGDLIPPKPRRQEQHAR